MLHNPEPAYAWGVGRSAIEGPWKRHCKVEHTDKTCKNQGTRPITQGTRGGYDSSGFLAWFPSHISNLLCPLSDTGEANSNLSLQTGPRRAQDALAVCLPGSC